MTKSYDKNLQIINNLDVQLNIFKYKELKTSVLQNFVKDFSQMNGISYNDDDIDAICEDGRTVAVFRNGNWAF